MNSADDLSEKHPEGSLLQDKTGVAESITFLKRYLKLRVNKKHPSISSVFIKNLIQT